VLDGFRVCRIWGIRVSLSFTDNCVDYVCYRLILIVFIVKNVPYSANSFDHRVIVSKSFSNLSLKFIFLHKNWLFFLNNLHLFFFYFNFFLFAYFYRLYCFALSLECHFLYCCLLRLNFLFYLYFRHRFIFSCINFYHISPFFNVLNA